MDPQDPTPRARVGMAEPPAFDGLASNPAMPWTLDKLRMVEKYARAFGVACHLKSGEWFYVDGFAGSGVNRIGSRGGRLEWGSPMLALQADPAFTRCLFLERRGDRAAALDHRSATYGDRRSVEQGNVNTDLLPLMRRSIRHRWSPVLVVLDPYGMQVDWSTLKALSAFRTGRMKVEILTLVPVWGIRRELGRWAKGKGDPGPLDRFWGDRQAWTDIWKRIEIWKEQADPDRLADHSRDEIIAAYEERFRSGLRYTHTVTKQIRRAGHLGGLKYAMLFATDHADGARIMRDIAKAPERGEQPTLPGFDNPLLAV